MEGTTVQINQAVQYGWATVKKDFWYFVGLAVLSGIISNLTVDWEDGKSQWSILSVFLSTWMTCGTTALVLSYQQGKKLPLSDLFTQFRYFWRVLGATLLVGIIVGIGLVLLIVPGIYFALRFAFVVQLIVDRNLGISEAMSESTRLTKGKKLPLFGFGLTMLGIMILGAIVFGVGVFVALPVVWLATVAVYRQVSGTPQTVGAPIAK